MMQSSATTALGITLVVLAFGVSLWAAGRLRASASARAIDGGRGKKEDEPDAELAAPTESLAPPRTHAAVAAPAAERRTPAQLEHNVEMLRSLLHQYILDREAVEDSLRENEERYRLLFDVAPRPIWVYDRDSLRFLAVNEAAMRQYGWSREEFLAMTITDLYPEGERESVRAGILRAGEQERERRTQHRLRSGETRDVLLASHAFQFANRPARLVLVEDITDRIRHEELLRRSERMASLGHTLAGVAHELNNPLAAIIGFAQLLLRDARTPDERSALETIHHEAARAGRIVKDLLAFARRQDAQPWKPVDLNAVVRHIADSQRYSIETRGIRRVVELAPSLPRVLGDASQLEQVVLNLVVNARQALEALLDSPAATRQAPRLGIRTHAEAGRVVLEVADEGAGIPAAQRERIWDPFWTTKAEGEGTGLGLSVVHGIVTAHGGTIAVESEPGEGTRFVVSLPAHDEAAGEEDAGPERPLDVLVVDDDADTIALAVATLGDRGHAVLVAGGAAQALRLAEHTPFDVVICGLEAESGGTELVHRLRQLPSSRRARYVVAGESLDGAVALAKPFDAGALRRAVEGAGER